MTLSLRTKIQLAVTSASIFCTLAAVGVASRQISIQGEKALVDKSRAILSRLEVARKYVAKQDQLRFTAQEAIKKFPDGNLPEEEKLRILKNVPIVAAMSIGKEEAEAEHYTFRIFAENPRKKENQATEEEKLWLSRFKNDPSLREIVETSSDHTQISVIRPVHLSESQNCLLCHGSPSQSPWKNGKDILGFPMEEMKDGDLKGAFAIHSSLAPVKATSQSAIWDICLLGGLFTLISSLIAFFMVRKSVNEVMKIANALGSATHEVLSASEQLSSAGNQLSAGASEGAASLEETVASIEELSSMVNLNSQNTKEAATHSQSTNIAATQGDAEIRRLIEAMSELAAGSKKIEEIIHVIDDIAFQTNLLALNAAVEAARAGEQGKGFAVVADAVRGLAQRSASAAKDINQLIKESVTKTENGSRIASESGGVLKNIVTSVGKIAQINSDISRASQEQATGLEQISKAMNQLDSVTQNNAASAEEAAASAHQLATQAALLQTMVDGLTHIVTGVGKATSPKEKS